MEPDIYTASAPVDDHGENITQMEPLLISDGSKHRTDLTDLSVELAMQSTGFRRSLPVWRPDGARHARPCNELLL